METKTANLMDTFQIELFSILVSAAAIPPPVPEATGTILGITQDEALRHLVKKKKIIRTDCQCSVLCVN